MTNDTMDDTPHIKALADAIPALDLHPRWVWTAVVDVAARESLGRSGRGERFIVPILGGLFWGAPGFEQFHGQVRAGGADRQEVRADGIKELDALYEMQTHDGAVITIHNQVTVDEAVMPERYAMSVIRVTAPQGPHDWLNRRLFVGTLQTLRPARQAVLIRGYLAQTAG
jgi:hypothetical protein